MRTLLADIGGTNSRCAMLEPGDVTPSQVRYYQNADFDAPAAVLKKYLESYADEQRPQSAVLAVAGPVRDSAVQMLNINWQLSSVELARELSLQRVDLLNDFAALAHALPQLGDDQVLQCGGGQAFAEQNCVVLGPGTGLGVAGLVWSAGGWHAVSGEGGHVSLSASTETEASLIADCARKYGHCSAERLISGPGLELIHAFLHGESGVDAAGIGSLATSGEPRALASLELMFSLLGATAGNLALTFGAFGGVYIGGGIVPRYREVFLRSAFRQRFEAKGRYADYLRNIPSLVITAPDQTLAGLAAWSRQQN